ncbi:MAG: hypothetical protein ABSF80_01335 [Chitinispirillaceae bacterium]|jgi:hypothetical protein
MKHRLLNIILLITLTPSMAQVSPISVDLRKIGHLAPKGRVQDKEYNPNLPIVDKLINAGPQAIPFLVSKLRDTTVIKTEVIDYWPKVCVGDVAWFILCDFFTTADWQNSTIQPGVGTILENNNQETPAWVAWDALIKKYGRNGIQKKVKNILKPYGNNFVWDSKDLCFRPAKALGR